MMYITSFRLIRSTNSYICGAGVFAASYENKSIYYNLLAIASITIFIVVTLPIIAALLFILQVFSTGNLVFIVALDALIVTVIILIFNIIDKITIGKYLA
mmetsp:Transcript_29163/g.5274  ORF Transcript_29163/g.5274 Transcript_29163/m.5274 type:complete len:100 (-) Transcript_29163:701-1000(-)